MAQSTASMAPLLPPSTVPAAFLPLAENLQNPALDGLKTLPSELPGAARASVLIMLANTPNPDLTFTERSRQLNKHPGQMAFPGGRREPSDKSMVETALREAQEEIGIDPAAVHVLGRLPQAGLSVSAFAVVPVVAWWDGAQPLQAVDPAEVASVHRWAISDLADPRNRCTAVNGANFTGPAWQFGELFLWGFTGLLVDWVLKLGGWEQPWDQERIVAVPPRFRRSQASTVSR